MHSILRFENTVPTENANQAPILRSKCVGRQKSIVRLPDAKHCSDDDGEARLHLEAPRGGGCVRTVGGGCPTAEVGLSFKTPVSSHRRLSLIHPVPKQNEKNTPPAARARRRKKEKKRKG